jgi:hypothetical protein
VGDRVGETAGEMQIKVGEMVGESQIKGGG